MGNTEAKLQHLQANDLGDEGLRFRNLLVRGRPTQQPPGADL